MKKQILTNEQKLYSKKIKKPPFLIYNAVGFVVNIFFKLKYGLKVNYHCDIKKYKGPCIMVSNHTSRADFSFNVFPLLPKTFNFVVGYNEFYRSHLAGIFGLMNAIPKKNFTPDYYAIKEISRVLNGGGRIFIYPEGMNSISGANQPVAIGTGKFIKHFKVPVYYSVIKGGYLTCPKYANDERLGKVEVDYYKMFSPEEIEKLSPEEIEDILNEKLYHDDFEWNKQKQYVYKSHGKIAENLHDLLFWCPKCGSQFTMIGKDNKIECTACGNGATVDDTYTYHPLNDNCVIPETQTKWFNMQREVIRQEVQNQNFSFSAEVELGVLPKYEKLKNQNTSVIVGKGKLTIDRSGLSYEGTKNGEPFNFHINSLNLPTYGMCTDMSRFYTFLDGEFLEFYPTTHCVEKFFLATEEIHRLNGGKWQAAKPLSSN